MINQFLFINYLFQNIIYEKKARTKTGYPKHRANDRFQYSHIIAFQQ